MRWSDARLLGGKDFRELLGSTPLLLLAVIAGPLVALSFITAVRAYAEVSSAGAGALAAAITPLDGIVVPTFGAYDLLITFLVPFVAIRSISGEKTSGAQKLMLQKEIGVAAQIGSRLVMLAVAWTIVMIPGLIALLLWVSYAGHIQVPETANVILGHTLHFFVVAALGLAAAAIADNAATAAIIVLTATIGSWAIDFLGAGRGGWIAVAQRLTPGASVRLFERGLLSFGIVVAAAAFILLFAVVAATFFDLRVHTRGKTLRVVSCVLLFFLFIPLMRTERSADLSEDRRNSFSAADERLLRSLSSPLTIELFLAAEDPRANDYERNVLTRLKRYVRDLRVMYPYAGQSALFENDERYGTIVYTYRGKRVMSRSTTEEIVLDEIETVAGLTPPARGEASYPGYPLSAKPRGAIVWLAVAWPLATLGGWLLLRRA